MNIFIELPTWLGDSVMTTPAIENLIKLYPKAKITFFGSFVSTKIFKNHPNFDQSITDNSKKSKMRFKNLYKTAKSIDKKFDLAFSFRSSFSSKFLLFFINADKKHQYNKKLYKGHQVEKYNSFINSSLNTSTKAKDLKIYAKKEIFKNKTLGINPGATYGSAKRWYPKEFAKSATALCKEYDIIIFGGKEEVDIAADIEKEFLKKGVKNYKNLAGKTTLQELIRYIGGLALFITNDSGPMHIASAFKIPTIAIFGPTRYKETSPWQNPNAIILRKELDCSPCMKRECPIKTHECMKSITSEMVLKEIDKFLHN